MLAIQNNVIKMNLIAHIAHGYAMLRWNVSAPELVRLTQEFEGGYSNTTAPPTDHQDDKELLIRCYGGCGDDVIDI